MNTLWKDEHDGRSGRKRKRKRKSGCSGSRKNENVGAGLMRRWKGITCYTALVPRLSLFRFCRARQSLVYESSAI